MAATDSLTDQVAADLFMAALDDIEARMVSAGGNAEQILPEALTFEQWVLDLAAKGLKVDGKPFQLENRFALRRVYRMIPTTRAEAKYFRLVVMKGAQTGLTVWEMLVSIWCALKFYPCTVGSYVPDMTLSNIKSGIRFMPILRAVPEAYSRLREEVKGRTRSNEGNVRIRVIGASKILFSWTTGTVTTESFPMDVLNFDEVQEMTQADLEKTRERMSASDIKMELDLSTAKFPDADIDYEFRRGTKEHFHTKCGCPDGVVLDREGIFPDCVRLNTGQYPGAKLDEYVYRCPTCDTYIPDAQVPAAVGIDGWVSENPTAAYPSLHFPQTLSPTVTPREMYLSFINARDLENFYRRKLGRPFVDPSRIPVTLAHLQACEAEGVRRGLVWLGSSDVPTYMGIDQMGNFNVVTIKQRLGTGHQAVVHCEMIFDPDPFQVCSELMTRYAVAVCVVEINPNYNDAKRFMQRHKGRVFLANYGDMKDEMLLWGDAKQNKQERKATADAQDHYTVTLNQYKCMQVSLKRFVLTECLFPDTRLLRQDVLINKLSKTSNICSEFYWHHLTKVALVAEEMNSEEAKRKGEEERKWKTKVVKVGIDPHFAYANMLCDVAYSRAHGTATFIIEDPGPMESPPNNTLAAIGLHPLPVEMQGLPPGQVCGKCTGFNKEKNHCTRRDFMVRAQDPGCPFYAAIKYKD